MGGLVPCCQVWGGDVCAHRWSLRPGPFLSTWPSLGLCFSLLTLEWLTRCEPVRGPFCMDAAPRHPAQGPVKAKTQTSLSRADQTLRSHHSFRPLKYFPSTWAGDGLLPFKSFPDALFTPYPFYCHRLRVSETQEDVLHFLHSCVSPLRHSFIY